MLPKDEFIDDIYRYQNNLIDGIIDIAQKTKAGYT